VVILHAAAVLPFQDGYEGSPFHDFAGRPEGRMVLASQLATCEDTEGSAGMTGAPVSQIHADHASAGLPGTVSQQVLNG
jgi:hypothetical protein